MAATLRSARFLLPFQWFAVVSLVFDRLQGVRNGTRSTPILRYCAASLVASSVAASLLSFRCLVRTELTLATKVEESSATYLLPTLSASLSLGLCGLGLCRAWGQRAESINIQALTIASFSCHRCAAPIVLD